MIRQGRPAPASPFLESTRLTEATKPARCVYQMRPGLPLCVSRPLERNNKLPLIRLKFRTRVFSFLLLSSDLLGGICYNHFIQILFLVLRGWRCHELPPLPPVITTEHLGGSKQFFCESVRCGLRWNLRDVTEFFWSARAASKSLKMFKKCAGCPECGHGVRPEALGLQPSIWSVSSLNSRSGSIPFPSAPEASESIKVTTRSLPAG